MKFLEFIKLFSDEFVMLEKKHIESYLRALNDELCSMNLKGEVCLYGGAVMCLVYDARPSTKDVDAVFKPTQAIRDAVRRVALANDLNEDWLNDAVKGFVVQHPRRILMDLHCLKVYVPEPDYLLAMKALSARVDATDRTDVVVLIKRLGIKSAEEVFVILEKYYPQNLVKPATRFFIEELFTS